MTRWEAEALVSKVEGRRPDADPAAVGRVTSTDTSSAPTSAADGTMAGTVADGSTGSRDGRVLSTPRSPHP